MSSMNELRISSVIRLRLANDGWTVDVLSTADPDVLAKRYKGVGHAMAKKIIAEARRVVNESLLSESRGLDEAMQGPPGSTEVPETQESVRVKRAKGSARKKNNET